MTTGNKDIRWQQRLANYEKALAQLQKFVDKGELSELEEQGLIKAFEYTYELAWNTLKDFLEYQGQTDIYGSRDTIRKAFTTGLIEDGDGWMDMLASRNKTSHTYNEETAAEISRAVLELYHPLFCACGTNLMDFAPPLKRVHRVTSMPFGLKEEVIEKINRVFAAHPEVEEAVLYGSRAKGNQRPGSDIDLTLKGTALNLHVLNRISRDLDDLLLPYTFDLSIFRQIANSDLLEHIERVGKVFYRKGG